MVSRRNYAAITIVMAIVFFLFQFLNMAKDHWNNYSTNQYAKMWRSFQERTVYILLRLAIIWINRTIIS